MEETTWEEELMFSLKDKTVLDGAGNDREIAQKDRRAINS